MADISRFIKAHKYGYSTALNELKKGKKKSHWMWYIFPQIQGLGHSVIAKYYGISSLAESREYMRNDILRKHMFEICDTLLSLDSNNATEVIEHPDDLKLHSSMTLFNISNPEIEIFQKVLDKFFGGEKDNKTIEILKEL